MRKKVYMFSEAIFMNPYQEENDGIVSLTDAGVKEIQAHKNFYSDATKIATFR